MSLLVLEQAVLRIAGRPLLDGADLVIGAGQRIGLVGRNGAGKSTLLKVITGELQLDGGTLRLARNVRLGSVRQDAPDGEASPLDYVLAADTERAHLLAEAETAPAERLADIHHRLEAIGADAAPARAATILAGLGFDAAAQARALSTFSGGWRMRVALAAALFLMPDLLLLDEPTNHLDLEATLWLETWLMRFPGAALIVSHDRSLLDRTVGAIAHLDRGRIAVTPGGFEEFIRIRTERAAARKAEAGRIEAQRARMQAFVDRFRYKASKARQAQSRLKAIARLPALEAVVDDVPIRLEFPAPRVLSPPLLTLDDVSVGYGGQPVLRRVSLRLDPDDRIALLGRNGNGKTTLARVIAERLGTMGGRVWRAPGVTVGYFAQSQEEELDTAASPLLHLERAAPALAETAQRAQLARFGLDAERVETPVASLSGGEKARLLLALATREAPPILVLDEPTNHLDIDAREALVRALADFPGAVVLISHDPHLVELVADRLYLVANGTVAPYDGDLESYRALLAEESRPAKEAKPAASRDDQRRERAEARAALAPLRRKARDAESALARIAAERARIEAQLADPATYARGSDVPALQLKLAALARQQAEAETSWLEAAEALEAGA
ncbi:MAG: ABC-F family ATP-binding cassette domain-containing protein [Rhodospirillales bacterium]|nr:ABC-F family ATP-binding cassette domain-containing protein [Rhodospirillales bacterium]